ncbi:MAG: CHASE2 domain-containing protein [Gammaproteobacteria bacterium]|nr:CHASE2 domain-containing protein [Gammaproteobacteria bacterium]
MIEGIKLNQPIRSFLVKALIIALCFGVVSLLSNKEFIRDNVGDAGFDITNALFSFVESPKKKTIPNVIIFAIDDLYMKNRSLLDGNEDTNYGYRFSRQYIADFLNTLDLTLKKENITIQSLFINYDFSFTLSSDGKLLTDGDKALINELKKPRPYSIFLPKTQINNFIETYSDNTIQQLINNERIRFVSVGLLKNNDNSVRRYLGFKKLENKNYNNIAVELWQESGGNNNIKEDDIIANRILIKSDKHHPSKENCETKYNNWDGYSLHSADCLTINDFNFEKLDNAILMLGSTYKKNGDKHNIFMNRNLNGIEMHANTLMTLFYLNGQVKKINWWINMIITFIITFFVDIVAWILLPSTIKNGTLLHGLITTLSTLGIMIILSFILLMTYGYWFNWYVPIGLYLLYEIYEFIIKLTIRRKKCT